VVFVIDGVDQVPGVQLQFTGTVGQALMTLPAGSLTLGSHTIVARYEPDGASSYGQSTSSALSQKVAGNTTTGIQSSSPSVTQGDPVTFTATIGQPTAPPGSPLPTGSVTFFNGSTPIGTAMVADVGGVATAMLTLSNLPVGTLSIHAVYTSDNFHNASTSTDLLQQVQPIAASIVAQPTTLRPRVNRLDPVTITAISPNGGTAVNFNGTVHVFYEGYGRADFDGPTDATLTGAGWNITQLDSLSLGAPTAATVFNGGIDVLLGKASAPGTFGGNDLVLARGP